MLCTRSDGRSGSDTTTVQLMIKSSQGKERIAALFIIKLYHWTPPPCLRVCLAKWSLAFLRLQYKSEFDTWQCHVSSDNFLGKIDSWNSRITTKAPSASQEEEGTPVECECLAGVDDPRVCSYPFVPPLPSLLSPVSCAPHFLSL